MTFRNRKWRKQWITEERIGARLLLLLHLPPISFGTCWRDEILLISVYGTPPPSYHVIQKGRTWKSLWSYLYYSLLLNNPPTYYKLKWLEAVNLPSVYHVMLWDSVFNNMKQIGLGLSVVLTVSKVCVTSDISRWYAAIYFRACGFALNSVCTLFWRQHLIA